MLKRTSQRERCMWFCSLEGSLGLQGGRLLIGTRKRAALPSEGDQEREASGSSKLNVVPLPGAESTQIRPSIRSTSSRQM
jgi:hypothetical protein